MPTMASFPSPHTSPLPSGEQITLHSGDWEATVVSVGAGLRGVKWRGVEIVEGYGREEMAPHSSGQLLAPWPNRLRDGRYTFQGQESLLPINERSTSSAIHGLIRWLPFNVVAVGESRCVMQLRLFPSTGYPFCIDITVTYELFGVGHPQEGFNLSIETRTPNGAHGHEQAPFGMGQHPYFCAPSGANDFSLSLAATKHYDNTDHGIPTGPISALNSASDLSMWAQLGQRQLDDCYSGFHKGTHGSDRPHAVLRDATWPGDVGLWLSPHTDYIMVYTRRSPDGTTDAVAVEPMSCAPDAFNNGDGLAVIDPTTPHLFGWHLRPYTS